MLLSFEKILEGDISFSGFGNSAYVMAYKDRPHISKSEIDRYSNAAYLNINEYLIIRYDKIGIRYIAVTSMSYDFIISVYDINSSSLFVGRAYDDLENMDKEISKFINSLKGKKNLEGRIIGLHNNQKTPGVKIILDIFRRYGINIYEIDIFGDQIRNIAMDSKLGVPYNILMLNRLYRPGELKSDLDIIKFRKCLKKYGRKINR